MMTQPWINSETINSLLAHIDYITVATLENSMLSLAIFAMKCWKCNILPPAVEWHKQWQTWQSVCHRFQEKAAINARSAFRFMKWDQEVLMKKLLPQIMCLWRGLTVWSPMLPCQTARPLRLKLCALELLWQFGHACCHSKDLYRYIFEWWFKLFSTDWE